MMRRPVPIPAGSLRPNRAVDRTSSGRPRDRDKAARFRAEWLVQLRPGYPAH